MAVLALGISFRHAPIDLLERLAFADDDLVKTYRHAQDLDGLDEAVVLSTCNRVEVYGSVPSYHAGFLALKRLLTETRGVPEAQLAESMYAHWERDAVEHLFSVAGGLDSMVIGETQIQSQVREALRLAEKEEVAGSRLKGLFHAATRAGRRVRQETSLGAAPDAFVGRGTSLAEEVLGTLNGRSVVVIGAGTMASLAVKHLRARGVGSLRVLNRSLPHARALAERTGADHGDLGALPEALRAADLVVSATGATGVVVQADVVRDSRPATAPPLVLLDLAVPRDVGSDAGSLPGVTLIDIDALRSRGSAAEEDAVGQAREIVSEEVRRFVVRRRGDELAPLIRAIRRRGDAVLQGELERHAGRLADLTLDERAAVEALARGIVAKLLHDPIVALKERSEPGSGRTHAKLLAELLGLDPSPLDGE
ncbi:MAG TPA: glutamyl-tRNA reductase [Actinomycetota bacterium]|nr:glutamyl-tRNA reductase [Actinomycetota bacterium]